VRQIGLILLTLVCCIRTASAATQVKILYKTSDYLTYDPIHNRIYSGFGSLDVIDPATATVTQSVPVSPFVMSKISLTDDGQYAYTSSGDVVARVNLTTLATEAMFSLGSHSTFGTRYVDDVAAVPGSPHSVVVTGKYLGVSPHYGGMAIYDDGIPRPDTPPEYRIMNKVTFGPDASTLYGWDSETGGGSLQLMSIVPTGIAVTTPFDGWSPGLNAVYANGKFLNPTGFVFDAATDTVLGQLSTAGPCAIEADGTRGYILSGTHILKYNLSTMQFMGSINVPDMTGGTQIIRFGNDGFAVRSDYFIYVINSTLVPEPAPAAVLLALMLLAPLTRRRNERGHKHSCPTHVPICDPLPQHQA
jgi:hypothetical protein